MLRSLNTAVSGLLQFQQEMDVIGNNIANVNTYGYKAARTEFADTFSQTLRGASPAFGNASSSPSMQVGTGVSTTNIRNIYTQGTNTPTGVKTDLAINGDGYFVVKDPVSNEDFATRAGNFRIDSNGYMITATGERLQGYVGGSGTTVGDLRLDDRTVATGEMLNYGINGDGTIEVQIGTNPKTVVGRVLLQHFRSPELLEKAGGNLYSNLSVAGGLDWASNPGLPKSGGLGEIKQGCLELSNVDMATEFTTLITTQRAYQANARMITTSDELLQEAVNLKR